MKKSAFNKETILVFHCSSKGLECYGEGTIGDHISDLFPPCDEDGNEIEGEYKDESGNGVGLTTADVCTGLGLIDIDGPNNSTYTMQLKHISYRDKEAWAAVHHSDSFTAENIVLYFCEGESKEHIAAICGELDYELEEDEDEEILDMNKAEKLTQTLISALGEDIATMEAAMAALRLSIGLVTCFTVADEKGSKKERVIYFFKGAVSATVNDLNIE